ncbi:MAG TPA: phenylalanine--tRNA ligase subunit alpha [Coriobacteriia bacterium]|nr:phenylalanine--tRNA ligase subunit alpha [Coriobacteriia bacterium]
MGILDELDALKAAALERIDSASDLGALNAVRVEVLGKKGTLTGVLRGLGSLPSEERPAAGKVSNEVRTAIEQALEARWSTLADAELAARVAAGAVDVTLPGRRRLPGRQHLISQIVDEVVDIFLGLGYQVAEGPEVELDYYNFTALNHPPTHPARSATDTFYVRDRSAAAAPGVEGAPSEALLRTHTSPMQIRVMEAQEPPVYVIVPGRVYRRDIADPSHLPQFHQVEGLVVDEGITFGDLKGTLDHVCKELFGHDRVTRFRPHFFPFTEPSAEVDVSCGICEGGGCRFCSYTGWQEILGCGMVDPNVFGYVGIDPERYTGFAFGMGVERIAALRHGVPDLRMLVEGDMRFLRQF